jgi:hypothetical protein
VTRAITSHEFDAVPEATRLATGERGGLPGVQSEADAAPSPDELRDDQVDGPELTARLAKTWGTDKGLIGTLSTLDHKIIGKRYIVTSHGVPLRSPALAPWRCGCSWLAVRKQA